MEEQVALFLRHLAEKRGLAANTASAYRTDLDQFVTFLHDRGLENWQSVSHDDVMAFLLFLRERRYANSTVARRTAAVKSFYAFLTSEGHVPDDPTERIDSPKVDRYLPKALSPHQVDELLEMPLRNPTPERLRDKAMIEMLYATGMRVSELVALNLGDVDMECERVRCLGKGGRERMLPLNDSSMTAMEEYFDIARPQLGRSAGQKTEALFLNHRGKRLTRQGFWLILKGYAAEVGIRDLTPHTLRHSFAAHMISNGADVRAVQALLGHVSLSTTQIYTQLQSDQAARSVRDGHEPSAAVDDGAVIEETVLAESRDD